MTAISREDLMQCLEDFFSGDMECPETEKCDDLNQLEAIMVAMVRSLREKLDAQDKRIAELEKKTSFYALPEDTCLTINCTGAFDTDEVMKHISNKMHSIIGKY